MNTKRAITINHMNARGTGAALRLALHPATDESEGYILLAVASQRKVGNPPRIGLDEDTTSVRLYFGDLCKVLEVLRGVTESLEDGKGLYYAYAAQTIASRSVVVRLRHQVEPDFGYRLTVCSNDRATHEKTVREILLTPSEALGIEAAITTSMGRVAFGFY